MAKTKAMVAGDARAVCYLALAKVAAKRGDRDLLFGGSTYDVDVAITGKVAGRNVQEHVAGCLVVGEDQQRHKSAACDQAELLAIVAAALDKPARDRLFKKLRETFRETGRLPPIDTATVAEAKALLTELRSTTLETARGNVTFAEKKD